MTRPPLDACAAICTGTSTLLLATHHRAGWPMLAAGVCFWMAVAMKGRLHGRPIWWMLVSNVWTMLWSFYGFFTWR